MKTAFSLLALIVSISFANAGGFGGPPPFTNGSPLVSGVDGSYQATARGTNLTGIFRFTYINGRQTSAPDSPTMPTGSTITNLLVDPYNDYVFFLDGFTYRGLVQANINTSQVNGVFDNGGINIYNSFAPGGTDPLFVQRFMSGFFNGTMDQQSPYAAFSGDGQVTSTGYTQDANGNIVTSGVFVRDFKFKGVRNSLQTTSS